MLRDDLDLTSLKMCTVRFSTTQLAFTRISVCSGLWEIQVYMLLFNQSISECFDIGLSTSRTR